MSLLKNLRVMAAVGTILLLAPSAHSQAKPEVTLKFGPPGFQWRGSGGGSSNHIWVAGDYWSQSFTGTGLETADSMTLALDYDTNGLSGGAKVDLDVQLNGATVGKISIPQGVSGRQTYRFTFAAMKGPDFRIHLVQTNTVPGGQGAVSLRADGQASTITLGK